MALDAPEPATVTVPAIKASIEPRRSDKYYCWTIMDRLHTRKK